MESFVPVCPRASNPVPPRPNAPRIKAQDRKWVTLEWDRVPADSDIKYFVSEKQEEGIFYSVSVPRYREKKNSRTFGEPQPHAQPQQSDRQSVYSSSGVNSY